MPATYEPIATQTLGSASANVTFSNIPQTYTDLVAIVSATCDTTNTCRLQFNGDTATNYSNIYYSGYSSTVSGNSTNISGIGFASMQIGVSSTIPFFARLDIFSYTNAQFKTVLSTQSNALTSAGDIFAQCGLWRSTAAITSITFTRSANNYNAGSTFTLYGILRA